MATLCSIPPELRIEILSKLPDLRSLAAAICTSRAIYQAFQIARYGVLERVLYAESPLASIIGDIDCLLPQDCVAALQDGSSSVRGKAIDMLCVHQGFVSGWCRQFCVENLQELPAEARNPALPSERMRIQRAFYRFWALSRAIAASGIKSRSSSDHLAFAKRYMWRYSLWEIADLTLIYRYIHDWTAIQRTISALALLDLPVLYGLLFPAFCTFETDVARDLTWDRSWVALFYADRTNRSDDSTAFPPRCICTRRDMPADEYDACLRGTADDIETTLWVECFDEEVRYDLALWDDSRLERMGLFLPLV
ncbi:hypothetical protein FN846DRAFT_886250 [Sphaerosporella brunnea]|uniref:F-box domain-containing protein n=1 Tax=Sphaerosporella brunnea TaxID=1250544 RepID=A0A5J5FAB5_9PEZI|nr:hypothetical protein FN846DRAFT_886250 [Sphaerosporella brunnea]